jgi:pilus assembly protein FimV
MKLKRFTTQLVAAGLIAVPLMANAAGLGKLSVTSALGQPLAAEIELFAADKAELDSLSATLASDQAFRDARVEFAPVLSSLRFTVVKKPNGKAVLKVTSSRPVNDPFIDLLVELNWASGRLVREYTMLLDPPGKAVAQTVAPVVVESAPAPAAKAAPEPAKAAPEAVPEAPPAAAEAAPVAAPEAQPAVAEPAPVAAPEAPPAAAEAAPMAAPEAQPAAAEPAPEAAPQAEAAPATDAATAPPPAAETTPQAVPVPLAEAAATDRVAVKRGDTLTGIAKRVRPEAVSLEQTLVGLYRENPHAFEGNINRLKAGKTLDMPSAETVAAVSQQDAVRELKLQAADWRAYRQKLAAAASVAPEAQPASGQASSGKITPKVEDRAEPVSEAQQDVLKLSKVTPPAAAPAAKADEKRAQEQDEDATAREKTLKESGQRVAMLEKQIQDMQKLTDLKAEAQSEAPVPAADESASLPAAPAAVEPVAPEPEPAPALTAPTVEAPSASPVPAENWYAPLLADPLYWGGGLAALGLGGVLWWMMAGGGRRRKAGTALEDSIITSGDVRPVNIAASGGSVNTGDSSFLTDFSQAGLGTIDTHDVDPIAEAEVYMAYGRDAQAEEILKEAIGKNPDRHEIRFKLLEIFAARRNAAEFEAAAGELYAALGSKPSPLWDKACEMGRSIDPTNPLYGSTQSGASPVAATATVAATAAVAGGAVAFADQPVVPKSVAAVKPAAPAKVEPEFESVTGNSPLDFESAGDVLDFETPLAASAQSPAGHLDIDTQGLNFELPDLDLPAATNNTSKLDLGLEDSGAGGKYDFSGFDLDLGGTGGSELDEVGTKLDLARAYVEMGDKEGAREILDEVLAEGSASQKADAKGLMSSLG